MKSISIVIPALNEKDGIVSTIRAIPKTRLEQMGYTVQILVVDNGSSDGTGDLAKQAGADVVVEQKRGYGSAFKCGFANAKGDIIATSDADGTYPVESIPDLVSILESEQLDFITTNRFSLIQKGAMPLINKIGNTILAVETKVLFGLNIRDPESGMWLFRRNILNGLQLKSDSWPFSHELKIEAYYFGKNKCKEIPITYKRRYGKTNLCNAWKVGFQDFTNILNKRIKR
jgi:hypothetical protein